MESNLDTRNGVFATLKPIIGDLGGAAIVLFGLMVPVLAGFSGLGVEVAGWYVHKERLQSGAVMSALAGAIENFYQGPGESGSASMATAAVYAELQRNGLDPATGISISVNTPPASGVHAGDMTAVEVVLSRTVSRAFTKLFLSAPVEISARAVATAVVDGRYCILALDPTAAGALTFSGSSTADLGCGVASNSTDASSIIA